MIRALDVILCTKGMEAWQKKLNEVLRLSNSFANAVAIPKTVIKKGKAAKEEYLRDRAADKPSSAQWVFEQAMLQQHSYQAETHKARDQLRSGGRIIDDKRLTVYWQRYMVCAAIRCRLRARVLRGKTRAQIAKGGEAPAGDAYKSMLAAYQAYYADVDDQLTANDLDDKEKAIQRRQARRKRAGTWPRPKAK